MMFFGLATVGITGMLTRPHLSRLVINPSAQALDISVDR